MVKKNDSIQKKFLLGIVFIIFVVSGIFAYLKYTEYQRNSKINSFEDCAKAGFPVMDSYPPQCRANDKHFTQDIGNELNYSDEFLISTPRPNQKIDSPLKVVGQATGTWYFEGSFSGELFDADKVLLGSVILTAEGEWMTEDFVPFKGTLEYKKPSTDTGTFIIKNANPSGLSENQKEIIIPVTF